MMSMIALITLVYIKKVGYGGGGGGPWKNFMGMLNEEDALRDGDMVD